MTCCNGPRLSISLIAGTSHPSRGRAGSILIGGQKHHGDSSLVMATMCSHLNGLGSSDLNNDLISASAIRYTPVRSMCVTSHVVQSLVVQPFLVSQLNRICVQNASQNYHISPQDEELFN